MGSESAREIARIQNIIKIKRGELKSPYASFGQKDSIRKYIADCQIQIQNIRNNAKHKQRMGTTGNSFKREVGKNAGKFLSTLLFGDRHSTPYRKVKSSDTTAKDEAETSLINEELFFSLDRAVLQNIDTIATLRLSKDEEELTNQLLELSVQLKANRWHETLNDKEASIRNKFTNALFEKYKQGIEFLKMTNPDNARLRYLERIKRQAVFRKIFGAYRTFVLIVSLIILVILGIGLFIAIQEGYLWLIGTLMGVLILTPILKKLLQKLSV